MPLHFTKMHGLGNDFIVIDAVRQSVELDKQTIIALAKRHTGIGFDQCLLVEPSIDNATDFFYRIFNANGEEVGQCGNGARCLARFVHHYKLTDKKQLAVATKTTRMHLQLNSDDTVTVDFGLPNLEPDKIPLQATTQASQYHLPLEDGTSHAVHALSVGNPHAITLVNNLQLIPVATLGKEISEHVLFPEQTNAGFMEIVREDRINLRVYERGCGETSACGSGAVAAAAAGRLYHRLAPKISVMVPGGLLVVHWPNLDGPISLTGPANFVFEGTICVESS
jgi:diaminopimelate epimerase